MSDAFPTIITKAGPQPQSPAALRATLVALATTYSPGLTTDLPASLLEDLTSTAVAALAQSDSAKVDLINSLTPYAANAFLLNQLGLIYGVTPGEVTNTSVYVVFTGTPGFVISPGFTVSDGSHSYVVRDGGIVESTGYTASLYAVATESGVWPVPADTVTALVTSVPGTVTLTVTNPETGTPQGPTETEQEFRLRVMRAGMATCQGTQQFLKTQVQNVAGVQARLVSVRKLISGYWQVLVGGGDPYAVANAIYTGMCDIQALTGSVITVTGITQANPGVVTTDLNHGLTTGQTAYINGATGMTSINGAPLTVTVLTPTTFSCGVNTSGYGAYTGNGVLTPNNRNVVVSVNDYPDVYQIPFVVPPQQTVFIDLTWNTTATNVVSDANVASLGSAAIAAYVNAIPVGAPINLFVLQTTFQEAIVDLVPPALLTRMDFAVSIDGVPTAPDVGTGIIAGDPESYFYTTSADVVIVRG